MVSQFASNPTSRISRTDLFIAKKREIDAGCLHHFYQRSAYVDIPINHRARTADPEERVGLIAPTIDFDIQITEPLFSIARGSNKRVHPIVHALQQSLRVLAHLGLGHHEVPPHIDNLGNMLNKHRAFVHAGATGPATPQFRLEDRGLRSILSAISDQGTDQRGLHGLSAVPAGHRGRSSQLPLHILNQLTGRKRGTTDRRRAHRFAAPAIHASIEVHQALPAKSLQRTHAESIKCLLILLDKHINIRMAELAR